MKSQALSAVVSLLFSIGTACSSNSSPTTSSTGGTSSTGDGGTSTGGANTMVVENCPAIAQDPSGNYKLASSAANNYSFTSNIQLGAQQKVAANTHLTINWSTLTKDMYNDTLEPKSNIGNMVLALYHLTKDALQTKINEDSLAGINREAVGMIETGGTIDQASTTDLTEMGNYLEPDVIKGYFNPATYPPAEYAYLVIVGSGTDFGKNGRMLTTFTVSTTASNTTVFIEPDSTTLTFTATLDQLTPITVPIGKANVSLDWTSMTTNAMARTVDPVGIKKVMAAEFAQPISDLQKNENFHKLESLAINTWSNTDLTGSQVLLSSLQDKNGKAFAGVDDSHTWILALEDTDSLNPAPWYIFVLKPCKS